MPAADSEIQSGRDEFTNSLSHAMRNSHPECEAYIRTDLPGNDPGRAYEKCTCQKLSNRPKPTLAASNDWRARNDLPPLPDNAPKPGTVHKISGRGRGIPVRKPWDVSQPSRGLGDTIAKITHATGIDKVVAAVTGKKGCGCKGRQSKLNELVPYSGQQ